MNQLVDNPVSVNCSQKMLRYVLITPARNEADYIELTLKSVISQTVKPLKWVIVSDGSTDATDEVVAKYAATNPWIELLRMPERKERHFAGKVGAFDAGFARVKDLEFDLVGNLDADISFDEEFFSFLVNKFAENPRLGLGGAAFTEGEQRYDYRFTNIEHVSGQCQIFRRQCFEEIGGYVPQKGGGIDVVVVLKSRMKGWETRTFQEKTFVHHRLMGTAKYGAVMVKFKDGEKDYVLGTHPLWELFRVAYQIRNRPYFIGACAMFVSYFGCMIRRRERSVSKEVMQFRRREQMARLRKFLSKFLPGRPAKIASDISSVSRAATGTHS
jgi:glycosyltransferase involved in cell wall biosynthesis